MTENTPAQVLEQEHRIIQRVVASMSVMAEELREGRAVEELDLREALLFLRVFADQCHHGKEERFLFPLLEARGVPPTGCPIGALKHEHDKGRALVGELEKAIEDYSLRGTAGALESALSSLVELYPGHIWKEDYLLLPMAGKVLSEKDLENLAEQFARVEAEIGPGAYEKFEALAVRLEGRIRNA
jgi:hemerythrin-like domain-containing protein